MKKCILLFFCITINVIANAQEKVSLYNSSTILYFDSNSADLKRESITTLDSIVQILSKAKSAIVSINGYCDNTGTELSNQTLSERRSQQVYSYIDSKHIPEVDLSQKGFGETSPLASNATNEGKTKNRRVEITIIRKVENPAPIIKEIPPSPPAEKAKPKKAETLSDTSSIDDLEIGKILIIKNLNFEGGTSKLLAESAPSLKMLLKLLKDNPTLEIEIEGHVCCANDMELSIDRALTVLEYLVKNGINEKRLKYQGHSYNNPIASELTEEGRKQNRRVEIMILKK
jgi:outer membrane protein OmpA-like peptidoglycan-associated protein